MNNSSRSMRVLHIILAIRETSAPYNEHCLPWANEREITICSFFPSDIAPPQTITLFEGDGTLPGFFRALRHALADREYDVIHAHSPHVGLLFQLAAFSSSFSSSRNRHASTLITVHDSYQNYKLRNRLLYIPVFAWFQRIICCSQASAASFPTWYIQIAGNRLRVVQNGVDIDRIDRVAATAQNPATSPRDFTMLAIGRLLPVKNPSVLLDAFQQSNGQENSQQSRLLYVGDGPLREELLAKYGHDSRIQFTGLIPRERVFAHLCNVDLFVSPSKGEGLPVSVLEAMACRCPVLLSDIPPHREIARGVDFIPLVPPNDVAGFAREIQRFQALSSTELRSIGQRCRNVVEQRFSLSAMHRGYSSIYAELMDMNVQPILSRQS